MILTTIPTIHIQHITTMTMATTSQANPAYNVLAFNGHDRLICLHQEMMDFLHYQSHIQYTATASLPSNTTAANKREQDTIIKFLKEECTHIKMLKHLLDLAGHNATELEGFFQDSPVSQDFNWGEIAWGLMPQWEQLLQEE